MATRTTRQRNKRTLESIITSLKAEEARLYELGVQYEEALPQFSAAVAVAMEAVQETYKMLERLQEGL